MTLRSAALALSGFALAACGGNSAGFGTSALGGYVSLPAVSGSYSIGPGDLLRVQVLQVPELSSDNLRVDPSGAVSLPVLGSVRAAGLTTAELAESLRVQLGEQYLQNPHVSVSIVEAADQKISVDGAVTKPGVYEMQGRTTLMQAIAMAEGATRVANTRRVAVFRNIDGQRSVALFDLSAIRAGEAADPVLMGDDVVVVDSSRLNSVLRDVVQALPGLAVFRSY